ncbi:MAG: phosphoribosyltransferase [Alphaproteobacteria bacterium]|nr:MAG: phosphoribosyltransferase [Alphaproteobacteria bacterium]
MTFADRTDAGRQLAAALQDHRSQAPIILALPRGGVAVAAEVARLLDAPLDLLIVRKLGVPGQPELAMGAVADAEPPVIVRNEDIIGLAAVTGPEFDTIRDLELAELARRRRLYLGDRPRPNLKDRCVIVVDDGIATGATTRAALRSVRAAQPGRIVLAVPVAAARALQELQSEADEIVCLEPQAALGAVGFYYDNFTQVSDAQVITAMRDLPR